MAEVNLLYLFVRIEVWVEELRTPICNVEQAFNILWQITDDPIEWSKESSRVCL